MFCDTVGLFLLLLLFGKFCSDLFIFLLKCYFRSGCVPAAYPSLSSSSSLLFVLIDKHTKNPLFYSLFFNIVPASDFP